MEFIIFMMHAEKRMTAIKGITEKRPQKEKKNNF